MSNTQFLEVVNAIILRSNKIAHINCEIFDTTKLVKLLNKFKENNNAATLDEISKLSNELLTVLSLQNIETYSKTLVSIKTANDLQHLTVHFHANSKELVFANTDRNVLPTITLNYTAKKHVVIKSSRTLNPSNTGKAGTPSTLYLKLKKYLGTNSKLCKGFQSFYHPKIELNSVKLIVDYREKTIYSSNCSFLAKSGNQNKSICNECNLRYKLLSHQIKPLSISHRSNYNSAQNSNSYQKPQTRSVTRAKSKKTNNPKEFNQFHSKLFVQNDNKIDNKIENGYAEYNKIDTGYVEDIPLESIENDLATAELQTNAGIFGCDWNLVKDFAFTAQNDSDNLSHENDIDVVDIDALHNILDNNDDFIENQGDILNQKKRSLIDSYDDNKINISKETPPIKKIKLNKPKHKGLYHGISHQQMSKKQLIDKIEYIQKERKKQQRETIKLKKKILKYEKLLHVNDLDLNNEWHKTFYLYVNKFDEFEAMAKDNQFRAEFDYDQARNRLYTWREKPTACIWRRASQLFFLQLFMRKSYYKHIKFMGYLVLPCNSTMSRLQSLCNHGPGMNVGYVHSYEDFQEEYWEKHNFSKDNRRPFLILVQDAVALTGGVRWSPTSMKIYGLSTSDAEKKMTAKSVFYLYKNLDSIQTMKKATQTYFIDLNSSFEYVCAWIGSDGEMDCNYLFEFDMEIMEQFEQHCKWKGIIHGILNDAGPNNQGLYRILIGGGTLVQQKVMMIPNPFVHGQQLALFWDNVHAARNVKSAIYDCRLNQKGKKILTMNGEVVAWNVMIDCWKINEADIKNMNIVTFYGLTKDCIFLPNNWSRQKWTLLTPIISEHFRDTLRDKIKTKHPLFKGAGGFLEVIDHLAIFVRLCISPKTSNNLFIDSMENKCFSEMKEELDWWYKWKNSSTDHCLAAITMATIMQFYETFPVFARYFFDRNKKYGVTAFLCVYRLTQNKVENLFSQLKQLGGGYAYLYEAVMNKLRNAKQLKVLRNNTLTPKQKHYHIQKLCNRKDFN